ncbi:MAG: dUTP diphosphatase [Spirochaetales bacterium]
MFRRPKIKFMKAHKDAIIPKFAHKSDAGMDLYAVENAVIKAGDFKVVATGLKMAMPFGYEAQIRARSGLAAKKGIGVLNGPATIDADYRGELGVILINHSKDDFVIEPGDRIAQMIISKLDKFEIMEVVSLDKTRRGEGGFGSTGVKKN